MKCIIGLGNPGKQYQNTRHNSGFMALDFIASKLQFEFKKEKWHSLYHKKKINGEDVLFVKPLTYMNDSGLAVSEIVKYYQIDLEDILVIHDDIDLPTGSVRIRPNGTSGGQKGMESIIRALGSKDIARIRIGVSHSEVGKHELVKDWVLSSIPKSEKENFQTAIETAGEAALAWIDEDFNLVMTKYNLRIRKERKEGCEETQ